MAISFLGSGSAGVGNGGDPSVNLTGLSLAAGDLVIAAYGIGDDASDRDLAMVTTGYNEVADLFSDDTRDAQLGVFWKVMGVTPDTTAVADGLGGNDSSTCLVVMAFRGVDTTTPMDATPTTATGANTNIPDPPSIDHNNPSGVWTVAVGAFCHLSGALVTATAPTNYDDVVSLSADDDTDICVSMAYRPDPGDPEDPGTFGPSISDSSSMAWCACTMALRPAAGAGGDPEGGLIGGKLLRGGLLIGGVLIR